MNNSPISFSALDFKVGLRMLARYPGLSVVGSIAIAVAIALGTVYFEALNKWQNPKLPIPDADRVISIRHWNVRDFRFEGRSLHDFALMRQQLRTVENLGAAIPFMRNMATDDGRIEPVRGAEMTANAFRLMGTPPLLGRALTGRDEQPGEQPVAVIGHSLWTNRFAGDPGAVGQTVKLGTGTATIVGVMPEDFAFPAAQQVWTPLRVDGAALEPLTGPDAMIFGRLAPGASIGDAQSELGVLGARLSASSPRTHEHLRYRVTPYAKPLNEGRQAQLIRNVLYALNTIFLLLLAVVCTNVATLVFARTATRSWEITVRSALGASRGRIVGQLFIEALVLASVAALVGLVLARIALSWGLQQFAATGALPFWIDASLSWRTLLYAAVLVVFGAAIVGILPALRVTKVNIGDALRSEAAGRAGLRFGGFWTAVIVVQVAITVFFLPIAGGGVSQANRFSQRAEGIGAERYLTASVEIDRENYRLDSASFAARARQSFDELQRRLGAHPAVERVAYVDRLPVEDQFKYRIEVDTSTGIPGTGMRTSTLVHMSPGYFDAFETSVVAGRDFAPLDFETRNVVIVNESFVQHVLEQRNAIGQRVRIVSGEDSRVTGEQWYEIVGVVRDFGWQLPQPWEQSAIYRPTLPTPANDMSLAIRTGDPEFAARLRTLAAEVDPTIRLTEVRSLADAGGGEAQGNWALTSVAWLVGFIVLMLSATGIHALMSFTVARRTREIGIRAALGARPGRIVAGVFARAFLQIGAGILVGSALAVMVGVASAEQLRLLLAADAIMLLTGLAACAVPVRRALSVNPTDALRAEG